MFGALAIAGGAFPNAGVKMTYMTGCAECHGRRGGGSEEGPPLEDVKFLKESSKEKIMDLISAGIPDNKKRFPKSQFPAGMPGFKEDLSKEEIIFLTDLIIAWNR